MESATLFQQYRDKLQKIADIKYAAALLQWDQETYIPPKGHEKRSRQLATLHELAHQFQTDEKLGNLLLELSARNDISAPEKRNITLSLDDYYRQKKFTSGFVRKLSEATSRGFASWTNAKKENRFELFKEPLHRIVELKKQEADILGYQHHPYDALMNDYDKGLSTAITDRVFSGLTPQLSLLIEKIEKRPHVEDRFLHQHFDKNRQWEFGLEMLRRIHFNFDSGRQDISEHPFTVNFCATDVRVTTRINEQDFGNMTWSCLHEGGHALYEQGLPDDQYGLPLGEYCSLSIHESQSRLWENCVGRGAAFWKYNFSEATAFFPQQLGNIGPREFYKGINKVSPSLIRTEADELTYHFHVLIRYQLEKGLIDGSITVADIPVFWNDHYKKLLGLSVPDDARGCLQDVHWSHGSFGYFATYSLGSLYAAQFYAAIESENESLHKALENGDNLPVLQWLRKHIYAHGRYYSSEELCERATGETLNPDHFINYVVKKYSDIYET